MNDNAIKNYAMWARRELISEVAKKCAFWGISDGECPSATADSIDGRVLTSLERRQRADLLRQLKGQGFEQFVETAAYTWFNRILAIRFMEVNDRLPSHVRVLSAQDGSFAPQALQEAMDLPLDALDISKAAELVQAGDDEGLFKLVFLAQCDQLAEYMPAVFDRIGGAMELMLPDGLLRKGGVIEQLVSFIQESDWLEGVEIIGWMYQYYVSERKDEVFASFKKGKKAERDAIAPATQLFTPNWIVRYLTENSLGRLWMLNNPGSALTEHMPYFIKPGDDAETEFKKIVSPEEITVVDPACGSGHILVYAFDLLARMYAEAGYSDREAARLIVEKNLSGFEIDPRAAAMASFAVTMKACELDSRFLRRGVTPKITVLNRVEFDNEEKSLLRKVSSNLELVDVAAHLDECGSLFKPSRKDLDDIAGDLASLAGEGSLFADAARDKLGRLQAELQPLAERYDVVVANPPYMGGSNMNKWISTWVKDNYANAKRDLCTCFIDRGFSLASDSGHISMITASSWMFISSFEEFRKSLLRRSSITSMIQQSTHGYAGVTVPTTMFVLAEGAQDVTGTYIRLEDFDRPQWQEPRALEALANPDCEWLYHRAVPDFADIPGAPIAYWLPAGSGKAFLERQCADVFQSAGRTKTHNNEVYLRKWWEISAKKLGVKWRRYCNGGGFSKWAGLDFDVVNWSAEAVAEYGSHGGLPNMDLCDKPGLCWGLITSSKTSFRAKPTDYLYSSGSPTLIASDPEDAIHTMAFLNSSLCEAYLDALNPTLNTTVNDVLALPCPDTDAGVLATAFQCINLVEADWNSFEASSAFCRHPLL